MKEFFFHNLSACEVEAVDTRVQAAAVAFELYGLAAEVSFRAEHVDCQVGAVRAGKQVDAMRELVLELEVEEAVGDGRVAAGRAVG